MDENLSTSIQSPKSTIPCSPEVIITGSKKKGTRPWYEGAINDYFVCNWKVAYDFTDKNGLRIYIDLQRKSNALSTISCDAVDWTTYLQTSVWGGGGFYKDFAGHAWNSREGNPMELDVPSWDLGKAHSSNSFRKSMLSTNTCNIEKNVYNWQEYPQRKMPPKIIYSQ
jgi:hypothetical protein